MSVSSGQPRDREQAVFRGLRILAVLAVRVASFRQVVDRGSELNGIQ
jgi:hypothetical protein